MYKHPYLIINAAGLLLVAACFAAEPLSLLFSFAPLFILFYGGIITVIIGIVLLVINLIAAAAVESNKPVLGILFSLLCGSVGGFIAAHTTNKNYSKTKVINLIFNAHMWVITWFIVSCILWWTGYYTLY